MDISILSRYISSVFEFLLLCYFIYRFNKISFKDNNIALSVLVSVIVPTQAFLLLANHPILSSLTYFLSAYVIGYIILNLDLFRLIRTVTTVFTTSMILNTMVFKMYIYLLDKHPQDLDLLLVVVATIIVEIVAVAIILNRSKT